MLLKVISSAALGQLFKIFPRSLKTGEPMILLPFR
jgi:hypothetical protein